MTSFNVNVGGRSQVLVDEQQLQQLQAEMARRGVELERLKAAMETLSAVNAPPHFVASAMSLCNELSSRWKAERVGIGFLKGRYVRLRALSHTEKITRNMQLVQDIESAMEECLDQDVEIILPAPKDASFVYRSTETLANRHGPSSVLSIPLRRERKHLKERNDERSGNVVAVLTLERKFDKPFTLAEVEALRLTSDLFTARLVDLYENDRWFGAKALRNARKSLAFVVGAKHTWAKVAAVAVAGFLSFACLVDGEFRVEAPFTITATETQIVSVPFDGVLETVNVEPGDMVFAEETNVPFDDLNTVNPLAPMMAVPHPATILAIMKTDKIKADRAEKAANVAIHLQEAQVDRAKQDISGAQRAEAQAAEAQAAVDLIDKELAEATIKAPMDGIVFQGDLKSKKNAPIQHGDQLFEIGNSDLRAELNVSEDQIMDVVLDQKGTLRATSYPDRPVDFIVERKTPIASVVNAKNVFKVRVIITTPDIAWLKPGVEGLGKIDVVKHKYGWIWTHKMVNWVRMKLWF